MSNLRVHVEVRKVIAQIERRCRGLNVPALQVLEPIMKVFETYLVAPQTPVIAGQHTVDAQARGNRATNVPSPARTGIGAGILQAAPSVTDCFAADAGLLTELPLGRQPIPDARQIRISQICGYSETIEQAVCQCYRADLEYTRFTIPVDIPCLVAPINAGLRLGSTGLVRAACGGTRVLDVSVPLDRGVRRRALANAGVKWARRCCHLTAMFAEHD